MSVHQRNCMINGAWGAVYLFDEVGEGLGLHRHTASTAHAVEVLGGSIVVYGLEGVNKVIANTGEVVDIAWDKWHEIRALAPHTIIFNKYLNGFPEEYKTLADEHLWSNTVPVLTHNMLEDGSLVLKSEYVGVFT